MIDVPLSEVRRAWAVLRPPMREELTSYPLDLTAHGEPCRLALGTSGERHLLVPVGSETLSLNELVGTLATKVRELTFAGTTLRFLDVRCEDRDVFDEFDEVVGDVLTAAGGSDTPAQEAADAIERWRRLFRSRLVRGLRGQELRGLFAELVVLDALLTNDASTPVSVWTGPLRQTHDFELADRCLEVKALGATSQSVVIHGLSQLAPHDGRSLDLVLVHIAEDQAGLSTSDLVHEIEAKVPEGSLQPLLDAAGWSPLAQGGVEETFTVAEVLRVPVSSTTPRLVEALLTAGAAMEGVSNVSYELDRSALLPHVVGSGLQTVVHREPR